MSKHSKIARGEAMECAASLDVLKVKRLIGQLLALAGELR